MGLLSKALPFFFLLFSLAKAAPPVNLTEIGEKDEEKLNQIKNTKNLKQGDLTYTEDHNQFNLKIPKDAGRIGFEVKGRSLPDREGRYLFRLYEGDFVKKLKDSKSGRWMMVQTFEKIPRRCWIPNSAVKFPQDKKSLQDAAGSSSSPAAKKSALDSSDDF